MVKTKILKITIFILLVIYALSTAKAESFNPEAISQVSKGIAEWKLVNEDKGEKQSEQMIYVSSSLKGMVEEGVVKNEEVLLGMKAFVSNPSEISVKIGPAWGQLKYTDIYDGRGGYSPAERAIRAGPSWGQVEYKDAYNGVRYLPSERVVKIGPSWLQIQWSDRYDGMGYSNVGRTIHIGPSQANAKWVNKNMEPEFITHTYTQMNTTDFGTYYRHTEIKTPTINNFERFALNRHPLGSYWDPTVLLQTEMEFLLLK